jgi:hypothetical protein
MASEVDLEIQTSRICKKLGAGEYIGFAAGFAIFSIVELSCRHFLPNTDIWHARGWFFPIAGLISIFAMFSSVSMQDSLRDRGAPHPLKKRRECIRLLLQTHDEEGLRLVRGIAMAANAYTLAMGMGIALCVFATVSP